MNTEHMSIHHHETNLGQIEKMHLLL